MRAECYNGIKHFPAPAKDCACGLYALKDVFAVQRRVGACVWGLMLGAVDLWGRIEEHDGGYRAEYARIVELYQTGTDLPEGYDVPVKSFREVFGVDPTCACQICAVHSCAELKLIKRTKSEMMYCNETGKPVYIDNAGTIIIVGPGTRLTFTANDDVGLPNVPYQPVNDDVERSAFSKFWARQRGNA